MCDGLCPCSYLAWELDTSSLKAKGFLRGCAPVFGMRSRAAVLVWRLREPSDHGDVSPLPEGRLAPGSWASRLQAGARVGLLRVRDGNCEHLDVHVLKAHAHLQGPAPCDQ